MNNEIKEILELNGNKYNVNLPKKVKEAFTCIDYELSVCSCELPTILDYITNLQQELEEEKRIEEADLKTIQRLEEENKILKEDYSKAMELIDKGVENSYKLLKDYKQENERLNKQVVIMEKYLELIYDIGFDYDGCGTIEGLKELIDDLVHCASLGRACNTTEPIYTNMGKHYNILHEEINILQNGSDSQ